MKKLITTALSCLTIATLSACGGGDAPDTVEAQGASFVTEQQAAKMREIDATLPQGYARYIVSLNPSLATATKSFTTKALSVTPETATLQELKSTISASGLRVVHQKTFDNLGVLVSDVSLNDQERFINQLKADPRVLSVTPDAVVSVNQEDLSVKPEGISTFPYDAKYWWGLDRINQRALPLDRKYSYAFKATSVTAYVVDTGISPHSELVNVKPGFSAIDDANGTLDCHGHGTAVASQIAGLNIGVTPGTATVPVRVMTCSGSGFISQILAGLDWIAVNGKKPAVINMSLGTSVGVDILDQSVQKLIDRGFVAVSAAGNSNTDACTSSPARLSTGITVGATNSSDNRSGFSNYGSCVHLFAPGEQLMAAYNADPNGYILASGTSFSAPHTSGVAALILEKRQGWSPASVKSQLIYQSTKNVVTNSLSATSNLLYSPINVYQNLKDAQVARVDVMTATIVNQPSSWKGAVKVKLKDAMGLPVIGAKVYGYFSTGASPVTCTTATDGACVVYSTSLARAVITTAFTIDTVRGSNVVYAPELNNMSGLSTSTIAIP